MVTLWLKEGFSVLHWGHSLLFRSKSPSCLPSMGDCPSFLTSISNTTGVSSKKWVIISPSLAFSPCMQSGTKPCHLHSAPLHSPLSATEERLLSLHKYKGMLLAEYPAQITTPAPHYLPASPCSDLEYRLFQQDLPWGWMEGSSGPPSPWF